MDGSVAWYAMPSRVSKVLSHTILPLVELTTRPPEQLSNSSPLPLFSGGGGSESSESNSTVGASPPNRLLYAVRAGSMIFLTSCASHSRLLTLVSGCLSLARACTSRSVSMASYLDLSWLKVCSFASASSSTPCTASSLTCSTLMREALSCFEYSIFFLVSMRPSRRSKSFLTRPFSASSMCSFSMLNSSSAETPISLAFS
mmetsp:Transcript_7639/g.22625  ORF Transcript_7639/g.22625 Transcript_7639/m.22625 type:complete len:201 (+) Transcript_7639:383-985(+)